MPKRHRKNYERKACGRGLVHETSQNAYHTVEITEKIPDQVPPRVLPPVLAKVLPEVLGQAVLVLEATEVNRPLVRP